MRGQYESALNLKQQNHSLKDERENSMKNSKAYFRGCLLGGAVGDAYGYPVEFLKLAEIREEYGMEGITELLSNEESNKALFSDDTQLTTFTVDGLLWADSRAKNRGIYAYTPCIFYAYQKWLYTQTGSFADETYKFLLNGEVLDWEGLFARRGPGTTSLKTLAGCINGKYGTIKNRINNSKGSGAVMRAAPIGLYFYNDSKMAFKIGCESGAITHGSPSGYLPAGCFAFIISGIIQGKDLEQSVFDVFSELRECEGCEETYEALKLAVTLAREEKTGIGSSELREAELSDLTSLGEGWSGEEALAMAVYCALKYPNNFRKALWLAVNHDGNSDTIGAICGNLLGAYSGSLEIPFSWIQKVELSDLMVHGADKMLEAIT